MKGSVGGLYETDQRFSEAIHYQSDSREYRSDAAKPQQRNPALMKSVSCSQEQPLKRGSQTAFRNGVQRFKLLAN